ATYPGTTSDCCLWCRRRIVGTTEQSKTPGIPYAMNALPDDLDDDLLYFFTFGPRTGESILLRIPPNDWVVVDSFKCDDWAAADLVIRKYVQKYGGQVVCIVLTHPHQDHHRGILELLENHSAAILGCMHPAPNPPSRRSSDSY